jgi:hypothetical protein
MALANVGANGDGPSSGVGMGVLYPG